MNWHGYSFFNPGYLSLLTHLLITNYNLSELIAYNPVSSIMHSKVLESQLSNSPVLLVA